MALIVGPVARGDNFWDRPFILEDMWTNIESGTHTLLVAPRRVGKTSLMFRLLDEPKEDYIVLYLISESAQSANAFWEMLFEAFTEDTFISTLKLKATKIYEKLKTIRINEAGIKGIKFGESVSVDYAKAFKEILKSFDSDKKLVIMMDEFSQTIENIITHESVQSAEKLLAEHRTLRQDPSIMGKVTFIYAGSIGLEGVVSGINALHSINDLASVKVRPLEANEAKLFVAHLCEESSITIGEDEINYILKEIEWYMPFYIQLIVKEVQRLYRRNPIVSMEVIDEAIKNALENRQHFEHWENRLHVLSPDEKSFAKEVLNNTSDHKTLESKEILNIGNKYNLDEKVVKEVLRSLVYDGYINNEINPKIYRFNSPILRIWWYKNVAN
ncbi:MAG: ATP-binding protein [Campylobacterota bacterium]|nr:ATP-binding protein [Campylobacterota bacterium]